jgi:hypothetical protein
MKLSLLTAPTKPVKLGAVSTRSHSTRYSFKAMYWANCVLGPGTGPAAGWIPAGGMGRYWPA